MVTATAVVTALLVTAKVAVVAPAAMVTETGAVAAALLLESVTTEPPAGAAAVSVTVPVLFAPPVTVAGFNAMPASAMAGLTVRAAVFVTPL